MKIKEIPNKVIIILRFFYNKAKFWHAESYLASIKRNQKYTFESLKSVFLEYWNSLLSEDIRDFTTPVWEDYNIQAKNVFVPEPPFSFLRTKVIMDTMFVTAGGKWLSEELALLEKRFSYEELKKFLQEDYVGNPILLNSKYLTSHNSIHHLYHIANFEIKTGCQINKVGSIIEWGSGYGNMAKIVKRINPEVTYTIIDMPLFSCIQWLYLSSILGPNAVNILRNPGSRIEKGKVNLLPVFFLKKKEKELSADVFIATWSLSESSRFAQDYVDSLNFFNSKHLLLAFQDSSHKLPNATRLGRLAEKRGARVETINFLPGNYYALR